MYIQAFKISDKKHAKGPSWRGAVSPDFLAAFKIDAERLCGGPAALFIVTDELTPEGGQSLMADVVDGDQVLSVQIDPGYESPEEYDPIGEIKTALAQNVSASVHDRRWLKQKEAAKTIMWWIRDNPACTAGEVVTQVEAAIAAETPGEPVVVNPAGLIETYAYEAHERGLIPEVTFAALKTLILGATEAQLLRLLSNV